MAPRSPSPTPVPAAVGTGDFPYKWDEIATKLGLESNGEIADFILAPIFLHHWTKLRDQMPLRPGTSAEIIPAEDRTAISEFTTSIYMAMDCMATSKYDRPTSGDRINWTTIEHSECLVYQCTRDLAVAGRSFHIEFERQKLKNEAGRKDALCRIRGLAMLVFNLIVNYTQMSPSNVIRKIEAKRPAKDPSLSPLPEVRRKWQLENMELDDLRKTVLDRQRKGEDEKQWLIDILMKELKDGGVNGDDGVEVKREGSIRVGGVKRKKEGDE
ncbi:hypothetical protein N0V87_001716 [Didymella glomerata]|jgi:hypothetical protein|uniref:Uncharacterized protein n=1 Tax=Didymella glomerata TaxID=749621 RepID=A0A9W8X670_9PLEO|nr:hypothetical protein N0V87_001716 [Didymella glomerata]